jgi:Sulfotransferase domain
VLNPTIHEKHRRGRWTLVSEQGDELPPTNSREKSVVFITMHRAGSVFTNRVITDIVARVGMVHVDFARTAFSMGVDEGPYCIERAGALCTPGYYFGAFRGPYVKSFGDLSTSRLVVQVRDPRDCIVSMYFAFRYSHSLPGAGEARTMFENARNEIAAQEIDSFSLTQTCQYVHRMAVIAKLLERYPEALLLRYEEMVSDHDTWLRKLCAFLGVAVETEDLDRYKTEVLPRKEDVTKHKRQILPGDYRRKLKIETQEVLTRALHVPLERFGYLESVTG